MGYTRIFVAAAPDEMEYEIDVALSAIRSLHLEPVTFEGLIPLLDGQHDTPEIEDVRASDLFVMILGKSLDNKVLREYQEAVRLQKPVLILVKMLKPGESCQSELLEFLKQVREQSAREFLGNIVVKSFKTYRRLSELRELVKESIIAEIHRQLTNTITTTRTRLEMYQLGTRIACAAKRRLYVVQQTAILLLGAREYTSVSSAKVWYEEEYLRSLEDWIRACVKGPGREFVFLYEALSTKAEMEKHQLHAEVEANLRKFKDLEIASKHRFHLVSMLSKHSGPMTVGDNWFALWIMGEHDAISISYVHRQVADELVDVLKPAGTRVMVFEDQMRELGLSGGCL